MNIVTVHIFGGTSKTGCFLLILPINARSSLDEDGFRRRFPAIVPEVQAPENPIHLHYILERQWGKIGVGTDAAGKIVNLVAIMHRD